jgi:rhodanese-related sulfurtransferase
VLPLLLGACAKDRIKAEALARGLADNPDHYVVVDVRSNKEWRNKQGHIPGATHIPFPSVKHRGDEIVARPDQQVVLVCFTGHRSRWSMPKVREAVDAPVIDLKGGMIAWWNHDLPTQVEPRDAKDEDADPSADDGATAPPEPAP